MRIDTPTVLAVVASCRGRNRTCVDELMRLVRCHFSTRQCIFGWGVYCASRSMSLSRAITDLTSQPATPYTSPSLIHTLPTKSKASRIERDIVGCKAHCVTNTPRPAYSKARCHESNVSLQGLALVCCHCTTSCVSIRTVDNTIE